MSATEVTLTGSKKKCVAFLTWPHDNVWNPFKTPLSEYKDFMQRSSWRENNKRLIILSLDVISLYGTVNIYLFISESAWSTYPLFAELLSRWSTQ